MKITAIRAFGAYRSIKNQNNSYKSQALGFDKVSFSGKNKTINPIIQDGRIATKNPDDSFKANEAGYSIKSNNNSISTKAKRFAGALWAYRTITQDNNEAEIGKDTKNYSLMAMSGSIKTNAQKYDGGIWVFNKVNQNNPEAQIDMDDKFSSITSSTSSVTTNAKYYEGGIYAGANIVKNNHEAQIGIDNNQHSLFSSEGFIVANAKEILGDVNAKDDIYIVGKNAKVRGTIASRRGKVYLVEAKRELRTNYVENDNFEFISMEEFETDSKHEEPYQAFKEAK